MVKDNPNLPPPRPAEEPRAGRPIALVQPFKGFDVSIGSQVFKGFRVTSEWNGMMELTDPKGRVLVIDVDKQGAPFDGVLGDAFAAIFGDDPRKKAVIVKGTPELVADLLRPEERDKT